MKRGGTGPQGTFVRPKVISAILTACPADTELYAVVEYLYIAACRGTKLQFTNRNASGMAKRIAYCSQIFQYVRQTYDEVNTSLRGMLTFRQLHETYPRGFDIQGNEVTEEIETAHPLPVIQDAVASKVLLSIILPVVAGNRQAAMEGAAVKRTSMKHIQFLQATHDEIQVILFASRYPTSPSGGSVLYDCLEEGLQTKEKLERLK